MRFSFIGNDRRPAGGRGGGQGGALFFCAKQKVFLIFGLGGVGVRAGLGVGWAGLEHGMVVSRPKKYVFGWPTATSNFYLFLS